MAKTHSPSPSHLTHIDQVEHVLQTFFAVQTDAARHISSYYATLWEEMSRLVSAGGKRLRPKMTLLAYQAFDGKDISGVVPIAASLELLHASLLMHDDIIDRDYTRYGVANVAGGYRQEYQLLVSDSIERTHYANSAALLGGDLLLSGAYQLIAQSSLPFEDRALAQQQLSEAMFHVAGGELLDTESSFRQLGAIPSDLVAVHKTASYTFIAPLLVGASLAGIAAEQKVLLRIFAETLGIAFQLQDDLLGVFGDSVRTGKTTLGDLREGKHTYMVEQFFALATIAQQQQFSLTFGSELLTPEDATGLRQLLKDSGALRATEEAIYEYEQRARRALAELDISDDYRTQFEELIEKSVRRQK
jgi:geranylgeranyl diphosphate synthase type II